VIIQEGPDDDDDDDDDGEEEEEPALTSKPIDQIVEKAERKKVPNAAADTYVKVKCINKNFNEKGADRNWPSGTREMKVEISSTWTGRELKTHLEMEFGNIVKNVVCDDDNGMHTLSDNVTLEAEHLNLSDKKTTRIRFFTAPNGNPMPTAEDMAKKSTTNVRDQVYGDHHDAEAKPEEGEKKKKPCACTIQ